MLQEAAVNLHAGEWGEFFGKNHTHKMGIFIFCRWKKLFKDYFVKQVLQMLY